MHYGFNKLLSFTSQYVCNINETTFDLVKEMKEDLTSSCITYISVSSFIVESSFSSDRNILSGNKPTLILNNLKVMLMVQCNVK